MTSTGESWKQREGSLSIALNRAPSFLLLEAGCGTLAANQVAVAVIGPVPYATHDVTDGSIAKDAIKILRKILEPLH